MTYTVDAEDEDRIHVLAAHLDELKPGWAIQVPPNFHLMDGKNCILFHVFGDYMIGMDRIENPARYEDYFTSSYFADNIFHDAWAAEIKARLDP